MRLVQQLSVRSREGYEILKRKGRSSRLVCYARTLYLCNRCPTKFSYFTHPPMKTINEVLAGFDEKFWSLDQDGGGIVSANYETGGSLEDIKAYISSSFSEVMENVAVEVEERKFNKEDFRFGDGSFNAAMNTAAQIIGAAKGEGKQ